MKKLMIAAAIVCAAALSQAATFTWKTSAVAYGPLADTISAGLENGKTYNAATATLKNRMEKETANLAIAWAYELVLTDADGNTDTLTGTIDTYSSGYIAMKNLSSDLIYNPAGAEDVNTVNYSLVMTGTYVDGDKNVWTLTSDTITGSNGFGQLSQLELQTGVAKTWTATTENVPEPTSAMLLLLGVAGLALKRRRA